MDTLFEPVRAMASPAAVLAPEGGRLPGTVALEPHLKIAGHSTGFSGADGMR